MKKLFIPLFLICFLCLGCTNNEVSNDPNIFELTINDKKDLSEKELINISNKIYSLPLDDIESFKKVKTLVDENIASFSEQNVIDNIILCLFQHYNSEIINMQNKLSYLGFELEKVVNLLNIDVNNKDDIEKISDEFSTIKGFLKEIQYKGLTLFTNSNSTGYSIEVDCKYFSDRYKDFISKDLKDYFDFLDYEIRNDKVLKNSEVDIDEIVKRLNMIPKDVDNIFLKDSYHSIKKDYYSILFGLTHSLFDNENGNLKESHISTLENIAKENSDNNISEIIEKGLKLIKEGKELNIEDLI